jgi:glutathione S-transferase
MTMKLFFAAGACSFVPHTLLEASGRPFDSQLVKLHKGEHREAAFLALNARGQVPVLVADSVAITQIVAIALFLDEQFPDCGFLPREGIARAKALETLCWMNNTVHPTFTHVFMPQKFTDDPQAQASVRLANTQLFREQLRELQAIVTGSAATASGWLSGSRFGPLDAYALTLVRWGSMVGIDPASMPELWSFVQRVAAHEPVAVVIARERLQLNMFRPA